MKKKEENKVNLFPKLKSVDPNVTTKPKEEEEKVSLFPKLKPVDPNASTVKTKEEEEKTKTNIFPKLKPVSEDQKKKTETSTTPTFKVDLKPVGKDDNQTKVKTPKQEPKEFAKKDEALIWVNAIGEELNISVNNFTSDFANGMAFGAILNHFESDLCDFETLNPEQPEENIKKKNSWNFKSS